MPYGSSENSLRDLLNSSAIADVSSPVVLIPMKGLTPFTSARINGFPSVVLCNGRTIVSDSYLHNITLFTSEGARFRTSDSSAGIVNLSPDGSTFTRQNTTSESDLRGGSARAFRVMDVRSDTAYGGTVNESDQKGKPPHYLVEG